MKRALIALGAIILLVALAGVAMQQLSGRPISADLSLVGQGQPALVMAFENYSPASMDAMDQLNRVRPDYEARVHFLVADLGTPHGSDFAARFELVNGTAVLLDGTGEPVRVYPLREGADELRRALERDLAALR